MAEGFDSEDLRRLRLEPLNQVAALKLRDVGVLCHPAVLPVFRLMEWELAVGNYPVHPALHRELLRLRHRADQRAAVNYLLENLPGGVPALHRRLLVLPPRAAAQELIDILELRLKADPRRPFPEEG